MRTLDVDTPGGSYPVHIGTGLLERAHGLIPTQGSLQKIALFMDSALQGERGDGAARLRSSLVTLADIAEIAGSGEQWKSTEGLADVWRWMSTANLHRSDLVVAFGGGVTGDLAGFAAATYNRGMPWIVVPTTLLAMVDSSIGGKTAIDLPGGKNLVGAFHQPRAVIADVTTLSTLPPATFATGMAEVVKHGLIDDPALLELVERDRSRIEARDPEALEELVAHAAAVKVRIVNEDETEQGARAFLNYGHTLGHALETLGEYTRWTHGQAISIGMMFAAHLASLLGHGDRVDAHRAALELQGLPTTGAHFSYDDVARMFTRDKKYDAGVRFVVLEDLGKPRLVREVPDDALRAAYELVR